MADEKYVLVRCTVSHGALPTERFVLFTINKENYTGFVPMEYVSGEGEYASVRGLVLTGDDDDTIRVKFPGSFIESAMGIFSFPKDWMENGYIIEAA